MVKSQKCSPQRRQASNATRAITTALAIFCTSSIVSVVTSFQTPVAQRWSHHSSPRQHDSPLYSSSNNNNNNNNNSNKNHIGDNIINSATHNTPQESRRTLLQTGLLAVLLQSISSNNIPAANAAVGTLFEYSDTNAILQGLTVDVSDKMQFDDTIEFFTKGFDGMKVLREGGAAAGVREVWLGFGPETLSVPPQFTLPVSSLSQYGGHASLHIRYDPSSTSTTPLYKRSSGEFNNEPSPGDSIAYLQLGVPMYRISQLVKYGGNVMDAYGWVNVVSPSGLPVRGIIGIRADPMMFLAVNCADVGKSEEFYAKLGFVRQEYPYARLNEGQGQFEPPQPKKSVYVAPSPNSMGILLLQNKNRKKAVVPNPVLRSLNVVYAPPEGDNGTSNDNASVNLEPQALDPSSIPVSFIPSDYLEKEIKATALPISLDE